MINAKTARQIAIDSRNPEFLAHHEQVVKAALQFDLDPDKACSTACMCFIVDGQYYVYGFDGVEIVLEKAARASTFAFAANGIGLVIR